MHALHLHIIDEARLGPTFARLQHKNVALDDVLQVLRDELRMEARRVVREPTERTGPRDRRAREARARRALAEDPLLLTGNAVPLLAGGFPRRGSPHRTGDEVLR